MRRFFLVSLLQGKYENLRVAADDCLQQPYRIPMIKCGKEILDATYKFATDASYISGAGPTIMAITAERSNHFFATNIRETLDEYKLYGYRYHAALHRQLWNTGVQRLMGEYSI